MPESPDEAPPTLEQTQAQLREGLDNARKLVEEAKFMLRSEGDESAA